MLGKRCKTDIFRLIKHHHINVNYYSLRNISNERKEDNSLKHSDEQPSQIGEKKKSVRHQKKIKYFRENRTPAKAVIVAPEHEFEEKFELRPPPKDTKHEDKNITDPFEGWFFRDTDDDLEASESRFYNHTEVSDIVLKFLNILAKTLVPIQQILTMKLLKQRECFKY